MRTLSPDDPRDTRVSCDESSCSTRVEIPTAGPGREDLQDGVLSKDHKWSFTFSASGKRLRDYCPEHRPETVGPIEQAVLQMTDMVDDDTRNPLALLARALDEHGVNLPN